MSQTVRKIKIRRMLPALAVTIALILASVIVGSEIINHEISKNVRFRIVIFYSGMLDNVSVWINHIKAFPAVNQSCGSIYYADKGNYILINATSRNPYQHPVCCLNVSACTNFTSYGGIVSFIMPSCNVNVHVYNGGLIAGSCTNITVGIPSYVNNNSSCYIHQYTE